MADPERDFGIVYDDQGLIQILQSPFFDVDPEVDHTVEEYMARILDTVVMAVEDQLGTVEWRLATGPQSIVKEIDRAEQLTFGVEVVALGLETVEIVRLLPNLELKIVYVLQVVLPKTFSSAGPTLRRRRSDRSVRLRLRQNLLALDRYRCHFSKAD
ncbi:hypothetical protein M5K25_005092 [Dendrobium thyrsiflorum]|uniref:Uncharacterized protein n=1 Tax=Dendrobium thyrsiflorum TaxID=117978 RepID=A0ABD0VNQ2_DENTH